MIRRRTSSGWRTARSSCSTRRCCPASASSAAAPVDRSWPRRSAGWWSAARRRSASPAPSASPSPRARAERRAATRGRRRAGARGPADRGQPGLGDRADARGRRRRRRTRDRVAARWPRPRRDRTTTRSSAAGGWATTAPRCCRRGARRADPLQRRRARDRRLRHRARRHPPGARPRPGAARLGGRDPAAAAGRAADRLGARPRTASPATLLTDTMAGGCWRRARSTAWSSAPTASPRTATPRTRSAPTRWRAGRTPTACRSTSPRRRSTIDAAPDGAAIPIEERARTRSPAAGRPAGIAVYNPAFDVTPAAIITAIVTEHGVHRPPYDFRADLSRERARASRRFAGRCERGGFDPGDCAAWPVSCGIAKATSNRVRGQVEPPYPGRPRRAARARPARAAASSGSAWTRCAGRGRALRAGRRHGHAHGRRGEGARRGAPRADFLDLRLAESATGGRAGGAAAALADDQRATDGPIRAALGDGSTPPPRRLRAVRLAAPHAGGTLFRDADGQPSVYATGHGDLPDALRADGLLRRLPRRGRPSTCGSPTSTTSARRWIRCARLPPRPRRAGDRRAGRQGGRRSRRRAGAPGRQAGDPESSALPPASTRRGGVFNTNTFLVDAAALAAWRWTGRVRVEKTVDERPAVQFERLLGEITSALDRRVPAGAARGRRSRFLPVKDDAELERNRP